MIRRPPRSTRTDTLFPYTTLFRSRHQCRQIWCALDRGGQDRPELDDPGWNAPSDVERKRRAGRATAITAWLRDNAAGAQLEIRRRNCPGRLRAGGRHMENHSADARSCGNKPAASLAQSGKRSEEHTSELQSLMRNSYAVFC